RQCERIRSVIGPGETVSHIEIYDGSFFLIAPGYLEGERYLPTDMTSFTNVVCGIPPGPENLELAADRSAQLSLETVGNIQADHVFLSAFTGAEDTVREIESSALWSRVPAVANGRVYDAPPLRWSSYPSYQWSLAQRADAVTG
ncbi:MAG: hypothetical protein AAGA17_20640, partial [Actinomycetota bacterium]